MPAIIIIGNCQANAIVDRLRRAYADHSDVSVKWSSSFRELSAEKAEEIRKGDIICAQLADFKNKVIEEAFQSTKRIINYPVLSLSVLWPASIRPHPKNTPTDEFFLGVFPGMQYCDAKANDIIAQDLSIEDALDAYMAIDFSKEYKLDRLFEFNRTKLRNLSDTSGVPVWDFYDRHFTTQRLHHTNMHPTNFVLDYMTEYLLSEIGLSHRPKADWQASTESLDRRLVVVHPSSGRNFSINQMPVHPAVYGHFGLEWDQARTSFYHEGDISFTEYITKYLSYEPNIALQKGVADVALCRFSDGLASLENGLEISPNAHNAWFIKALVHWRLGDFAASIASLDQALAIKPGYQTYVQARDVVATGSALPLNKSFDNIMFAGATVDPLMDDAVVLA